MTDLFTQEWVHWRHPHGYYTINAPEQLIARTFALDDFPEVLAKMTPEERDEQEAENKYIAKVIAAIPDMVRELQLTASVITTSLDTQLSDVMKHTLNLHLYSIKALLERIDRKE